LKSLKPVFDFRRYCFGLDNIMDSFLLISARQHVCYSALYAITRPSVTRVDQSKRVEVRIMQPSPQSSPMTLVSWHLTSRWNSKGKIGSEGAEWHRGRKNTQFSANKSPYLRNDAR